MKKIMISILCISLGFGAVTLAFAADEKKKTTGSNTKKTKKRPKPKTT
jgi:hypothetical protein